MNIVNKLTFRQLKTNLGRSIVTTLGIIISVAMITAVFVATASFFDFFGNVEKLGCGDTVLTIFEGNREMVETLKKDERIERVGVASHEHISFDLGESYVPRDRVGTMYLSDKENSEQIFTVPYEGHVPEHENEIAVEESFIEKNHLDWKIGDEVRIPIGDRVFEMQGESVVIQDVPYSKGETFVAKEEKSYTVTAILHNNYPTYQFFSIIRGIEDGTSIDGSLISVQLKNLNYKSRDVLLEIIQNLGLKEGEYDLSEDMLEAHFAITPGSTFSVFLPAIVLLLIIIIIASVTLIHNAFAISLSERVRYLGMLASVGATRAQKRGSIYFEGFILGCIGIPLGILSGIIGISITLKLVGSKIVSTGMIMGITDEILQMRTVVPFGFLVLIVLFSIFTIFLSAFIPARKASKITPIDAIRRTEEIKRKAKSLRVPRIIRMIFGYEGELAYKNQKRNGRKGRVIIVSIILSMVLFLSVNYFCALFSDAVDLEEEIPYQLSFRVQYSDQEQLEKVLEQAEGVDDYYSVTYLYNYIGGEYTDEGVKSLIEPKGLTEKGQKIFEQEQKLMLYIVDDPHFNQLCEKQGIDRKKYYEGELEGLLVRQFAHGKKGDALFQDSILGETCTVGHQYDEKQNARVIIGDLVDYDENVKLCQVMVPDAVTIFIPESSYLQTISKEDNFYVTKGIETKSHKETCQAILDALEDTEVMGYSFQDMEETTQTMNTLVFVLKVFVYGFIVLITLITVANIINTVSTGIILRKKEFAMLQSVGMTPKGFRKMITLESLLYGIRSVIIGIPLSIAISFWIYHSIGSEVGAFHIDFLTYGIVIAVILGIVSLTMFYGVHSIKNESIVGTLKQEISE